MENREWRALSIKQPWIDLILRGIKTIEVRNWAVKKRGPIILHASGGIDWKTTHLLGYNNPFMLDRGKLVGYAEIVDVVKFDSESWIENFEKHRVVHPMFKDSWGVMLENVKIFKRPIPHKGKLYFFPIEKRVIPRVEEEIQDALGRS